MLERKKLDNVPTVTVDSKFAIFEYIRLQRVGNTAREGHRTLVTDLDELKQRLSMEWVQLDHVGLRRHCDDCYHWHRRRVQISACFVIVHPLLQYLAHSVIDCDSNLANLEAAF